MMLNTAAPTVAIDFQAIYAAILLLERRSDGRYPERLAHQSWAIPLTEYIRQAAVTGAALMEIDAIFTNSDGSMARRLSILERLGIGTAEQVIDPGIDVARERLAVDGVLSDQCNEAINRWYGRV